MQDKMYIDENLSDGLDLDDEDLASNLLHLSLFFSLCYKTWKISMEGPGELQIHQLCRLPPR
jgi:hypothetical protein